MSYFFALGVWFVPLGVYMSKSLRFDGIIGAAYGMFGLATIASTLFVGMIADRYFASQRLISALLICSAISIFGLSLVKESQSLFLTFVLLHCLFAAAAAPVCMSMAFSNLDDPKNEFPAVRVWGTIGWIFSGLLVGLWPGSAKTVIPMYLACAAYLFAGIYALTLPHTPPKGQAEPMGVAGFFGLDIMRGKRDRVLWIFIFCLILVAIPKKFYDSLMNNFLVEKGVSLQLFGHVLESTAVLTLGQIVEALTLLMLPLVTSKIGIKWVMVVGMAAWGIRFMLFAFGFEGDHAISWMVILGILLHGFCYDFFFVSAQIWFDQRFAPEQRARAQSFFWFVLNGVGVIIGANIAGATLRKLSEENGQRDWQSIWSVPAGIMLFVGVIFILVFRETKNLTQASLTENK